MVFNRPPKSGKGRPPLSRNPARPNTTSENNRSHKTLRPSFDKKGTDQKASQDFDSRSDKKGYRDKPFHKRASGSSENTFRQDRPFRTGVARPDRQEGDNRFARSDRRPSNDRSSHDRFDRSDRRPSNGRSPNDRFDRSDRRPSNDRSSHDRFDRGDRRPSNDRPSHDRFDRSDRRPSNDRPSHDRFDHSDRRPSNGRPSHDRFSSNENPRAARTERPFRERSGDPRGNGGESRPSRFSRDQRTLDRSPRNDGYARNDGYRGNRSEDRFSSNASRDRNSSGDRRFESRGYNRNLAVNPSYSPDARPFKRKRGATEPASARTPREHGEQRIAKLLSRAGIASRRMIESMIEEGRIAVNGVTVEKPATLLTSLDGVTVDGKAVGAPSATRLFLYHKATGLLTTERDPEGRMTIYDRLPSDLPRVMPVGRLDMNTEGLLLLTTDGGFKRALELPATHIERCYRARVFGDVSQDQLEDLIEGVTIDGIHYGSIDANLERRTGRNGWVEMKLHEGRNREVRRVLGYLGLQVSRLIRISYGPFLLGDLPVGAVEEVDPAALAAFKNSLPEMS